MAGKSADNDSAGNKTPGDQPSESEIVSLLVTTTGDTSA